MPDLRSGKTKSAFQTASAVKVGRARFRICGEDKDLLGSRERVRRRGGTPCVGFDMGWQAV
ncbi:hypothetical protein HMPREF9123_2227 [Neisseria bacilliformis ATCC BAA-1200]|uniref:Uncharacterized protein n=1 Tax=Neisseria bacilliformis ATCC BAA-1200 TaxID=888742 RepID=F2BES0_9NEIS|nr:hypothetical protein HMPREF9123_2227 [Neisseria bacilliformis ATCC BAA-1200]